MKRVVVLGAGRVGATIAKDLADDDELDVTVADASPEALERAQRSFGASTIRADLADPAAIAPLVQGFDVAVGALPSAMGSQTLRAMIDAGVDYCDISFMSEDPLELDGLAKERGVVAVVDCGVSPGISNVIAGYCTTVLDPFERFEIYVGGLPVERQWPYEYKAAFAPSDVIEEYVRPTRLVVDGELVVREALSEPEPMDFEGVGTLEAFNTDGLRTLASTLEVPNMREKTLRYPGHIELMRVMRETGLFSTEPVEVNGVLVSPRDLTSALLFPQWTYEPGEADLTVLRVIAEGKRNGESVRMVWEMTDYYDPATDTRSMARTTGYPAAVMTRRIARGELPCGPGVHPPETPGRAPGFLEQFLTELTNRGLDIRARVESRS